MVLVCVNEATHEMNRILCKGGVDYRVLVGWYLLIVTVIGLVETLARHNSEGSDELVAVLGADIACVFAVVNLYVLTDVSGIVVEGQGEVVGRIIDSHLASN